MLGHYLLFDGQCAEALGHYEKALDATITELRKYSDMPPNPAFPVPEEKKHLVLHARLTLLGQEIMCADASERATAGDNMYLTITTADEAYVKNAWALLSDGGTVYMELTPSFFAALHGSLRDKYGVNWMFTVTK